MSETDTLARSESWSVRDVRQYNAQLAKREIEVAGAYVPEVAVGSICGACTRGNTVAVDTNRPRQYRRPQGTGISIQQQAQQAGAEAADQVRTGRRVSRRRKGNN